MHLKQQIGKLPCGNASNHYYMRERIVIKKDTSPLAYVTIIQICSGWGAPLQRGFGEHFPASGKSYTVCPPIGEASRVAASRSSLIYPKISKPE